MTTVLSEYLQKSLATGIACGRSVRLWARRHGVDFATAYDLSIQQEIRDLVFVARLRVADRLIGKLARAGLLAIDQLVKLCTKSASDSVRLSASRVILTEWRKISEFYDLNARLIEVEKIIAADKETQKFGEWIPASPYK